MDQRMSELKLFSDSNGQQYNNIRKSNSYQILKIQQHRPSSTIGSTAYSGRPDRPADEKFLRRWPHMNVKSYLAVANIGDGLGGAGTQEDENKNAKLVKVPSVRDGYFEFVKRRQSREEVNSEE